MSDGCTGCYAEALMDRRMGRVKWGAGEKRQRTSEAYWRQPLAWNKKAAESGQPWRVFCGSLCDIFDNEAPRGWRRDLFTLIDATPSLTWMLLTKRIGNAAGMLRENMAAPFPWPNVWIGATVVNQEEADRDIPKLLSVPAAVRFLSIEPMLGPINLAQACAGFRWEEHDGVECCAVTRLLDWVIVGGESDQPGHRARPFRTQWARSIIAQCKAANVPVFCKQLGSFVVDRNDAGFDGCESSAWPNGSDDKVEHDIYGSVEQYQGADVRVRLVDRAGADPSEWPEDLRVREFPR